MVADPAQIYTYEDFQWHPGLMLEYDREVMPEPEPDPNCIHCCPPPPKEPHGDRNTRRPRGGTAPIAEREMPKDREELTGLMKREGWTYRTLATKLGMSDKILWKHLSGGGGGWERTWNRVAEFLGRPDLKQVEWEEER